MKVNETTALIAKDVILVPYRCEPSLIGSVRFISNEVDRREHVEVSLRIFKRLAQNNNKPPLWLGRSITNG